VCIHRSRAAGSAFSTFPFLFVAKAWSTIVAQLVPGNGNGPGTKARHRLQSAGGSASSQVQANFEILDNCRWFREETSLCQNHINKDNIVSKHFVTVDLKDAFLEIGKVISHLHSHLLHLL